MWAGHFFLVQPTSPGRKLCHPHVVLWSRNAILCVSSVVAAQPAPHFDVISIRRVPSNAPPFMREIGDASVRPGGQYIDPRTPPAWLIQFAYDIPTDFQLLNLPDWAKHQEYSISAKPGPDFPNLPPAENAEQVRFMMRALLAERFHLKLHAETRQEAVYNLEVAKGGLKIREVGAPEPPAKETPVGFAFGNNGGRMIGKKSTIVGIADTIEPHLKRPVIDKTGLTGYYDFDIRWSAPDPSPDSTAAADAISLLISALPERLGLRLTKGTGPVQYWIVDHVEPPTEN
jgi:uncharacterized protein (TIGR03435 family)